MNTQVLATGQAEAHEITVLRCAFFVLRVLDAVLNQSLELG